MSVRMHPRLAVTRRLAALVCVLIMPSSVAAQLPAGGSGTTPPITATGPLVSIVDLSARGVDSLSARLQPGDTSTRVIAPKATCGPAKVCPRGWDVLVADVTVPAVPAVPLRAPVWVRVRFANRGSAPSPAAEARVCLHDAYATGCQQATAATIVEVPPLPSLGEVELSAMVRPQEAMREARISAEFDWDGLTDELKDAPLGAAKKANNLRTSSAFGVESAPDLEWINLSLEATAPDILLRIEVRNVSAIQAARPASYVIGTNSECGSFSSRVLGTVEIGPLAPRQRVVATVRAQLPKGLRISTGGSCRTDISYVDFHPAASDSPYPPHTHFSLNR